jgi:hypothetical protein
MPSDTRAAAADPRSIVRGAKTRFTALTDRLLRLEWSDRGVFTDASTQFALRRRFPPPAIEVERDGDAIEMWTEHLHLSYAGGPFRPGGLKVTLLHRAQSAYRTSWTFGENDGDLRPGTGNLGGTVRTLDDVDGACPLGTGILARHGYAVLDDSDSLVLTPDGWLEPRPAPQTDLYLFGYGRDFAAALRDFARLAGPTPLVPRYALGNWWSRYHRYRAGEYRALLDRFEAAGIPLAVAVLDMDWHLVDIDPELGSGWTGYTWNRDLFPDPGGFLDDLHDRGLAVACNVHPADGVRRHEAAYDEVARDVGVDPASGRAVPFDPTSRTFLDSYLTRLHHPHEDLGVDLWWIDWQSGTTSRMPGLDPLWLLNHLHHRDSGRGGDRPLILSRYAGLGSHRYPIGFSGDTVTSWDSLDFQPRFTAAAANIGYVWWSHDIGGHLGGDRDAELATRWVQFGVLSPVMRLHSATGAFASKEPWRFPTRAEAVMTRFLRLRHRLVPYLYTAMWAAHTDAVAPVRPLYHDHPTTPAAFEHPNVYLFGPDMVVAPLTSPADEHTGLAAVTAWLPPGDWVDLLTAQRYRGDRRLVLHRPLEGYPILVRAGAVVTLAADPTAPAARIPDALEVVLVPGADGSGALFEDAGGAETTMEDRQETAFSWWWQPTARGTQAGRLRIEPPRGPGVRTTRTLTVTVLGAAAIGGASGAAGGVVLDPEVVPPAAGVEVAPGARVQLGTVDLAAGLDLELDGVRRASPAPRDVVVDLLDPMQIALETKDEVLRRVTAGGPGLVGSLHALDLPGNLFGALLEALDLGD